MDDLTGTSGERTRQLAQHASNGPLPPDWLHRQLELTLAAWADDEKTVIVDLEGREDY